MWPFGRCGILRGGYRLNRARAANDLFDGQGKLIPADPAFVAIMINTGDELRSGDDLQDDSCQVRCIGRRPYLVIDHREGRLFLHQPDHGLYKIMSELRIYPGGTDDGCLGIMLQRQLFPL